MVSKLAIALMSVACLAVASANFVVKADPFSPALGEAEQRKQDNYAGFTFNFNEQTGDFPPNGKLVPNAVNTNPFLSTLPGDGNAQTLVVLGPCASNTPHTHPRGSEISLMLYGQLDFAMTEENAGKNIVVGKRLQKMETIHIPQGLLHWSHNPTCEEAAFIANFATKDPGTQTMWESLFAVPTNILHAASGLPESVIDSIKKMPLLVVPSTGGEACLKKCGLKFNEQNKFKTAGVPFKYNP